MAHILVSSSATMMSALSAPERDDSFTFNETDMVKIVFCGKKICINIPIDKVAQRSFITSDLMKKFNLQPKWQNSLGWLGIAQKTDFIRRKIHFIRLLPFKSFHTERRKEDADSLSIRTDCCSSWSKGGGNNSVRIAFRDPKLSVLLVG